MGLFNSFESSAQLFSPAISTLIASMTDKMSMTLKEKIIRHKLTFKVSSEIMIKILLIFGEQFIEKFPTKQDKITINLVLLVRR